MRTEPRRVHLASGMIVLITFLVGAAAGAGLHASFGPHPHGLPFGPLPRDHRLPPHFEALGLSADQRTQAEALFEKHRPQFEAVFEESLPKVRALQDEMDGEFEKLLTAEQKARFAELRAHRPPLP